MILHKWISNLLTFSDSLDIFQRMDEKMFQKSSFPVAVIYDYQVSTGSAEKFCLNYPPVKCGNLNIWNY